MDILLAMRVGKAMGRPGGGDGADGRRMPAVRSVGFDVDEMRFGLGIHDLLRVIKAVVAGEHVADGNRRQIVGHTFKAK